MPRRGRAGELGQFDPNVLTISLGFTVPVYVLVAVVRKRLRLEAGLYQILQILSVTLFEKAPMLRTLQVPDFENDPGDSGNQSIPFDFQ